MLIYTKIIICVKTFTDNVVLKIILILYCMLCSFSSYASYRVSPMSFDIAPNDRQPKHIKIVSHSEQDLYLSLEMVQVMNKGHYAENKNIRLQKLVKSMKEYGWNGYIEFIASKDPVKSLHAKQVITQLLSLLHELEILLVNQADLKDISENTRDGLLNLLASFMPLVQEFRESIRAHANLLNWTMGMQVIVQTFQESEILLSEQEIKIDNMREHPFIAARKIKLKPKQRKVLSIFNMLPRSLNRDYNYKIKIHTIRGQMKESQNVKKGVFNVRVGIDLNYHLPFNVRASNPAYKFKYQYYPKINQLQIHNNGNSVVSLLGAYYCNKDNTCNDKIDFLGDNLYAGASLTLPIHSQTDNNPILVAYKTAGGNDNLYINLENHQ